MIALRLTDAGQQFLPDIVCTCTLGIFALGLGVLYTHSAYGTCGDRRCNVCSLSFRLRLLFQLSVLLPLVRDRSTGRQTDLAILSSGARDLCLRALVVANDDASVRQGSAFVTGHYYLRLHYAESPYVVFERDFGARFARALPFNCMFRRFRMTCDLEEIP